MSAKPVNRCDICQFKDGHNGLKLLQCKLCKMFIHQECYGLSELGVANFLKKGCQACRSVGKIIMGKTAKGVSKNVVQKKRPRECVLCCVRNGVHAMNPLYNEHGRKGRQVVLPNGNLAWVHSLCALAVCTNRITAGCIYGCDIDGNFEDVGDEDEDEEKGEKTGSGDESDSSVIDMSTHHYVFVNDKDPDEEERLKVIKDSRSHLKCIDCPESDKSSFRIAIQCSAGDEDECEEFKKLRPKDEKDESCYAAMHVGCAMWGTSNQPARRIFFFPGNNKEPDAVPVLEAYCPRHAKDIACRRRGSVTGKSEPPEKRLPSSTKSVQLPRLERKASATSSKKLTKYNDENKIISNKTNSAVPTTETSKAGARTMKKRRSETDSIAASLQSPKKIKGMTTAAASLASSAKDLPTPPSYSRHSTTVSTARAKKGSPSDITKKKEALSAEPTGSKKRKNIDKPSTTSSVSAVEQPNHAQPKVRRRYISESKMNEDDIYDDNFDWVGLMVEDVKKAFSIMDEYPDFSQDVLDSREYYWKRKSGIYGRDFEVIWSKVKDQIKVPNTKKSSNHVQSDSCVMVDVDIDEANVRTQSRNHWDYLWKPDAAFFTFKDWDTVALRAKQEAEETEEVDNTEDANMEPENLML